MKAKIFLCYARQNIELVKELYQKLSRENLKPWMDIEDILPGEDWKQAIRRAIQESDFFLACMSNQSVDKRGVIQEEIKNALDIWRQKLEYDIYLIPIRLEDCSIPESLRKFQWVNLFEENGWSRLLKAIQTGIERMRRLGFPVKIVSLLNQIV